MSLAMGFANLADAMEMMILSILAPALHCHWHITEIQQANITTVVFLGKPCLIDTRPEAGSLKNAKGYLHIQL
jgi:hypothetical protein